MIRSPFPVLLLAAAVPAAVPAAPSPAEGDPVVLAQLTIRQRVVIRVPRVAPAVPVAWKEGRGAKCVAAADMAGAVVHARDRIDLVLRGGRRVRARLDDECRGLDFYSGFYLRPDRDGMVCAGRDAIRSRSGARCEIARMRLLEAVIER